MLLANIGLPMVCFSVPTMLLGLFPIALVEAVVFRWRLDLPFKKAFSGAFIANLLSTIIGIPLVWLPLVFVQIATGGSMAWGMDTEVKRFLAVTWQAPWLIPYQGHLVWMVPAASLVLLLPFFLGSVLVEFRVLTKRWNGIDRKRLLNSVVVANAASYSILAAFYLLQLVTL